MNYKLVKLFLFLAVVSCVSPVSAMQLSVKTVDNRIIAIDVEASDTILQVKQKVFEKEKDFDPRIQQLIWAGKQLEDDRTVSDYRLVNETIRLHLRPNSIDPLLWAAQEGDLGEVKKLLDAGADIEMQNRVGETPLLVAIGNSRTEVVKELLARGADVKVSDKEGVLLFIMQVREKTLRL